MRNKKVLLIVQAALIAAIYVVLTYFISAFNLASGAIQVRISEALTILPVFTPAAIPGLFIGCLLSNLLTGCMPLDVVFGSLATLIGACGTYALRKHKWLAPLPPIVANTVIVPFVLAYVYMAGNHFADSDSQHKEWDRPLCHVHICNLCCADLFYQRIQSCLRRNSGPDFRSTYHFTGIYAGSHSGTFYRMPVKQSAHRLHAA